MSNNHADEHLAWLERQRQHHNQLSTQIVGNLTSSFFQLLLGARGRTILPSTGHFMEIFLRYNFGVRYFSTGFTWLFTAVLGLAFYFSTQALFFAPSTDPQSLLWALSILITSIVFLIPWAVHCASIFARRNDLSGNQHTEHSGDAWLDFFEQWARRQNNPHLEILRKALQWVCATENRRDFLGETVLGIGVAYIVGWICLDHFVTYFLLVSLFSMQGKRRKANAQKLLELQKLNDAEIEMQRRQQAQERRRF